MTDDGITLYTHPMSPCAQKVRIVLAEKGVSWTGVHVNLAAKENLRPAYLKLNSQGVVPTLVHRGVPIVESSVICEYLDDAFPEPALMPRDPLVKAEVRNWMKHVDVKLHPSCGAIQWPMIMRQALLERSEDERNAIMDRIPDAPRRERQKRLLAQGLDAPDVKAAVGVYRTTVLRMEETLKDRPWIAGEGFTLGDACLAPYFQTLYQFQWGGLMNGCERVQNWYDRVCRRPSYEQAIADDFPVEVLEDLQARGERAWPKIQAHMDQSS